MYLVSARIYGDSQEILGTRYTGNCLRYYLICITTQMNIKNDSGDQKADVNYSKKSDDVSLNFQDEAGHFTDLRSLLGRGLRDIITDMESIYVPHSPLKRTFNQSNCTLDKEIA